MLPRRDVLFDQGFSLEKEIVLREYFTMHKERFDISGFAQVPEGAYQQMLIRRSLGLNDFTPLEPSHVQESVEKALRFPLRQSVGSCFATCVAILIQKERVDLLIKDLADILYRGGLVRVVEGHECIAPLSPFYGAGYPLLKAWEFTIASLTDYDHKAYRYNFHSSLGLDPNEPEGLGRALWEQFEKNFVVLKESYQKKFQDIRDHESALQGAQLRLNSAFREEDMRRVQAEMQLENMRLDMLELDAQEVKKKLIDIQEGSKLFFEELDLALLEEFYEVYDPEIAGEKKENYQDSEAGFRLVWKNGLKNISQHIRLKDLETYIFAVKEFFLSFERRMVVDHPQLQGLIESSGIIVQQMLQSIPFRRRLESKQPWAYPSGGSLETLLEGYFETKGPFQKEESNPENPQDLLVFYLDLIKSLSGDTIALFQNNPAKRLLALFPTHAFSLIPGAETFREGWEDPGFSYTWVRDHLIQPSKKSLEKEVHVFAALEKTLGLHKAYEAFFSRFHARCPFVIFGDSNWETADQKPIYLAFQLDPKTMEIGVFRRTIDGSYIFPMLEWIHLFDGKELFTVYTRPFQYGGPYTTPRLWQRI